MKTIQVDASLSRAPEVSAPIIAPELSVLRPGTWARRLVWILAVVAAVWAVAAGVSFVIQHTSLKDRFTAHIAAALGRPVEVGSYGFTLWGGPTLQVQSVSVAEDPRFGQEYFLRAESL
jgi:hypothetical protein